MTPPTPRLATQADLQAVQAIVRDAYTPYVARIGRPPGPMLDDYQAQIAASRVHVLEHDGVIKGILVLIPGLGAMLLDNIAVVPTARGAGLGRALLQFAERAAHQAGYRHIRLYTHESMTENIALYGRIGYAETHRIEENGFKRVYMQKLVA